MRQTLRRVSILGAAATLLSAGLNPASATAHLREPAGIDRAHQRRSTDRTRGNAAERKHKTPPWADFSYRYDPRDLYKEILDQNQWRRLWGPVGIGEFHIFPAQLAGPYRGPPLQIWGHGFGTSLWRDPVTGWPLM